MQTGYVIEVTEQTFQSEVLERADEEVLQPRKLYERQGRLEEYEQTVARLEAEREAFLKQFEDLSEEITDAI